MNIKSNYQRSYLKYETHNFIYYLDRRAFYNSANAIFIN
jgi:hypothetical protein